MGTRIYWFSGTGNSLAAARRIADRLGDAEVVSIAREVAANGLQTGEPLERIGLVFPTYAWGVPVMVARFLREMQAAPETYIFAVATYGGYGGAVISQARRILSERGLGLAAAWRVRMIGNYPPMGGACPPEKQKKLLAAAEARLDAIAADVADLRRGTVETAIAPIAWVSRAMHSIAAAHFPASDAKFFTDERCDSCGICARVCPSADIRIVDGKPQWQGRCEQCFACLSWCPQEAIHYGKVRPKLVRYHHPDVQLADMLLCDAPQ